MFVVGIARSLMTNCLVSLINGAVKVEEVRPATHNSTTAVSFCNYQDLGYIEEKFKVNASVLRKN